jgi:two-component system chemotaxis sensor kinase CheA
LASEVDQPAAPAAAAKHHVEPAPAVSAYQRMGGMGTIDAVVEVFYRRMLADLRLKAFYEGAPIDHLQGRLRDYLAALLGGPNNFGQTEAKSAQEELFPQGLAAANFEAMLGHLQAALAQLDVSNDITVDVGGIFSTLRDARLSDAPPLPPKADTVASAQTEKETKDSAVAQQTIRVNVELLENLMTMVSELVLTRNQVLQILRSHKQSEFATPLQRLNHVTSELQEGVMKTRMQPVGTAWSKLPRLVRDLSHELKKKIELVMIGQETELDRQVLEMIKDPLTHMVRNACDHGLEGPEIRRKAGKPEAGKITLNAYHEGGHLIIEISDDGYGLDVAKIRAKIIQNNLASEGELDQMTDQQIYQYIFKPGFSTASKVTSVSGRGVGMDVVKTNIDKIGGTVELRSQFGKGTTFVVKIPLTLAIVSALIVACAGERFAVPQISVVELVRVSEHSELKVEKIKDTPVLRLRNRLLPLVSLRKLLHLDDGSTDVGCEDTFIVVTQVGAYSFGIMVDRVFDTEEIVVKPVSPILRHIDIFSGNTILGDGSVIMILDLNGIAQASGQMGMDEAEAKPKLAARETPHGTDPVPLLVFTGGEGAPKAVPLALIARLEEFPADQIESSNGRHVVQYRGELMPLVPLYPGQTINRDRRQSVLVFTDRGHAMGLLVDTIVDIVEAALKIELSSDIEGRLGSAIVNGRATDIVDTSYYLGLAFPNWFGSAEESTQSSHARLLLVDDSAFFRNILVPRLTAEGYEVTAVDGPDRALSLAESGEHFDVIVSDIEMPGMDGFAFCENVKKHAAWQDVPILALSSRARPQDMERGRHVGFRDYIAKYDREGLVESLRHALEDIRSAA